MKDIWDFMKGLFQKAEESTSSNPYLHELIVRSSEEKLALEEWKHSLPCRRTIDWLGNQYALWQVLPDDLDDSLMFLNTPSSKGFVIYLQKTGYKKQEAVFLLEYLKEKVLAQNYKVQLSDTRSWVQKSTIETVERHYLKPRPSWSENSRFEQLYGNITIELSLKNDLPHLLKFRATSYSDHMYAEPKDFKGLMQSVLA